MQCEDLIMGCFAGKQANFAEHDLDRDRAFVYLTCARRHNLTWSDVKAQIRRYLEKEGVEPGVIINQVSRAERYLRPWLE